jgi:hypothetical protein
MLSSVRSLLAETEGSAGSVTTLSVLSAGEGAASADTGAVPSGAEEVPDGANVVPVISITNVSHRRIFQEAMLHLYLPRLCHSLRSSSRYSNASPLSLASAMPLIL